jgi:nucleoside-diphosphate-sugar epimerase
MSECAGRAPQRVLVTGGRSMLGATVARRLASRGDRVTVLQRHPAELGLPERLADVADSDAVFRAVEGQDAVVHLAAKVGVSGTWPDFQRTNVTGTETVVSACRELGIRRLVHVSSPSVAHAGSSLVGVGAGPAEPEHARGHYARSKAMAERIALAADSADLKVLAIRPHLVWGPDDTVDAIVAALDRVDQVHGIALVVSNGEPRPIAELIAAMAVAGGAPAPRRHLPAVLGVVAGGAVEGIWAVRHALGRPPAGDPPMTRFLAVQLSTAHWFDQRQTRTLLGWRPSVSLAEGFERLAAAYGSARVA